MVNIAQKTLGGIEKVQVSDNILLIHSMVQYPKFFDTLNVEGTYKNGNNLLFLLHFQLLSFLMRRFSKQKLFRQLYSTWKSFQKVRKLLELFRTVSMTTSQKESRTSTTI